MVEVQATAENANYYSVVFEEGEKVTNEESANGKHIYRYRTSGTHRIRIRAHATAADYIELIDTVNILLSSEGIAEIPSTGYTTPMSYDGYTLVWNDEFDGSSLNTEYWNYQIGTGTWGWGNNELQYYLKENVRVKDGYLSITAKQQQVSSSQYTSSRITTQGKKFFKYGRIDIRAAMPQGKGIWPALWMLGESHATVGWPECGEIDIMEMVGGSGAGLGDNKVHGTAHWDKDNRWASSGGHYTLSSGILADEFHVYSIVWNEYRIRWYIDDISYYSLSFSSSMSEFKEAFFFIFNVAVGGNWPGSPDQTTLFPQSMHVDYVRVFQ